MEMIPMPPQMLARLAHFLLAVIPLIGIGYMHLRVMRRLDQPLTATNAISAHRIHGWMWFALLSLWVTGVIGIVAGGYANPISNYLLNPKLLAKVTDVTILTVNAFFLHFFVISRMREGFVFAEESLLFQLTAALSGALSLTSWGWAFVLGLGKEWSYVVPFESYVHGYSVTFGVISLVAIIDVGRYLEFRIKTATSPSGVCRRGIFIAKRCKPTKARPLRSVESPLQLRDDIGPLSAFGPNMDAKQLAKSH